MRKPASQDEYTEIGFISRLANGHVARTVGLIAAIAMVIPIGYFFLGLLTQ